MIGEKIVLVFASLLLHTHYTTSWSCTTDGDCADISGSVCSAGVCACPVGQQRVGGGSMCASVAPYYSSPCVEDHQCSRLFPGYQCRGDDAAGETVCRCQDTHHYHLGRCWPSRQFGEACTVNEECLGTLRDPQAMTCLQGACTCGEGYYLRQRGECRKSALAVGDECVLDVDCQFEGGLCDRVTLTCYDVNNSTNQENQPESTSQSQSELELHIRTMNNITRSSLTRNHDTSCGLGAECPSQFVCSENLCVCPLGYYLGEDSSCLAELGSAATEETCSGLLAVVKDGVCTCPDNFYYDENMRDCVKAMIRFTDSCISDAMCHSFGASSYCGPPQEPWGLRYCACVDGDAVWDETLNMCRLFATIGEFCEVDSDCLAGNVEILCDTNENGVGVCACPAELTAVDGLCLSAGLELGDTCQVSQECGVEHSLCENGVCACDSNGYQQSGSICAPTIGGSCSSNTDCVIENTVCVDDACQCAPDTVEHEDACWTVQETINGTCAVDAQCESISAECVDGYCLCPQTHHQRGDTCLPRIGLFESCSRNTECYLGDITDRVVCRNSLCQCDFDYPYNEELHTCSSATTIYGNLLVILSSAFYIFKARC